MKNFLFLILLSFTVTAAFAQCPTDCELPGDPDYTFTHPELDEKCACFFYEENQMIYCTRSAKADRIEASIPETEKLLSWLIDAGNNKKWKLKTEDILFLERAVNSYHDNKMDFGFEMQENGLGIKWIKKGTGKVPQKGKKVTVHYTGYFKDGTKFDSSKDRNQPFSFNLGAGQVIQGWDLGVAMLPVGSVATLRIPPSLGYGDRQIGPIPPNSTLYFDIEVLDAE